MRGFFEPSIFFGWPLGALVLFVVLATVFLYLQFSRNVAVKQRLELPHALVSVVLGAWLASSLLGRPEPFLLLVVPTAYRVWKRRGSLVRSCRRCGRTVGDVKAGPAGHCPYCGFWLDSV